MSATPKRRAELPQLARERLARIALAAQGLHRDAPFGRGTRGVQRAIEHLGYVQIDTISVVARAHHHTLFTRVPDYQPEHLDRLQDRRRIFEYWFHAASYLPMRDYRYALPRMHWVRDGGVHWVKDRDRALENAILERVRADGPLCTRDLGGERKDAQGWWNWSPEKRAIETLFFEGSLLCVGRDGFAKVYDLPERALASDIDTSTPTDDEFADYLVRTHLRAHGFAAVTEFTYLRRGKAIRDAVARRVANGVDAGELVRARVAGDGTEIVVDAAALATRPKVASTMRVLSPFDNAVIQRDRTTRVHAFDYLIECYTPEPKRKYGYFCLPLLFGERFVGRADCKADRKARVLQVKSLFLEHDDALADATLAALPPALRQFAAFNGCERVTFDRVTPRRLAAPLLAASRAIP